MTDKKKCVFISMPDFSRWGGYWISLDYSFLQYCDSNIGLFSIAPPLVIAFQLCDSKVVDLTLS